MKVTVTSALLEKDYKGRERVRFNFLLDGKERYTFMYMSFFNEFCKRNNIDDFRLGVGLYKIELEVIEDIEKQSFKIIGTKVLS